MTKEEDLKDLYFDWIRSKVYDGRYARRASYKKLLTYLFSRPFTYILPIDGNRFEDGINLRYRFGMENGLPDRVIARELDIFDCSVLEMMVALCIRVEETIMANDVIGNRTGQWFWEMVVSLGLGSMYDSKYDEAFVQDVIDKFLDRQYRPDGRGGLFTIESYRKDLRDVDIWYQMMWHLEDVLEGGYKDG